MTGLEIDSDDDAFYYRTGIDYEMGIDGELKGPDGAVVTPRGNDYRYQPADTALKNNTRDMQKQLEEEKRKKEESDRKIKELEEKIKTAKPGALKRAGIKKNIDVSYAMGPSPVSSIAQWF